MSLKRYGGNGFSEIGECKRFDGERWKTVTVGKRYDGSAWQNILPDAFQQSSDRVKKTYSPLYTATYWNGGNKDTQYPSLLIQGSYNASASTARRSLIIFNNAQLRKDIAGASIVSARLKLKRTNTAHGISGKSSVFVKLHGYSTLPQAWNGGDLGNADSGTPTIARGETIWVTLNNSALQKILSGEAGGIALDADSNYSLAGYVKYEKSAVQLEVVYEK